MCYYAVRHLTRHLLHHSCIRSSRGVVESFAGHYGPVTAVHQHPSRGELDFSDYILSACVDWSIKLWSKMVCGENMRCRQSMTLLLPRRAYLRLPVLCTNAQERFAMRWRLAFT